MPRPHKPDDDDGHETRPPAVSVKASAEISTQLPSQARAAAASLLKQPDDLEAPRPQLPERGRVQSKMYERAPLPPSHAARAVTAPAAAAASAPAEQPFQPVLGHAKMRAPATAAGSSNVRPGAYPQRGHFQEESSDDDNDDDCTTGADHPQPPDQPMFVVTAEVAESDDDTNSQAEAPLRKRKRLLLFGGAIVLLALIAVVVGVIVGTQNDESTPMPSTSPTMTPMPTWPPSFQPSGRPTLQGDWLQVGQSLDGVYDFDRFGLRGVALNGNGTILAIGTIGDELLGNRTGRVYAYQFQQGSGWRPLGQVLEGQTELDTFGYAVALSQDGTIMAVSAPLSFSRLGSVRMFQLVNGSRWIPYSQTIVGQGEFGELGTSVALSADGNVVAVGAPLVDIDGRQLSDTGQVRVYSLFSDITWNPVGDPINGVGRSDRFGLSVDLSANGTILAVGTSRHDGIGVDSGHVRVFRLSEAGAWRQLGKSLAGELPREGCGASVSLSGNGTILAFGCDGSYRTGDAARGDTRIFRFSGQLGWTQIGQDITGEGPRDESGETVVLSEDGTVVAISAPHNNRIDDLGNVTFDQGHVRVFRLSAAGDRWYQIGPDIEGVNEGDFAGAGLSMSDDGTVLAIGSGLHENVDGRNNTGHVRVFELEQ